MKALALLVAVLSGWGTAQAADHVVRGTVVIEPGEDFDIEVDFAANGDGTVMTPGSLPRADHTVHITFKQGGSSTLTIANSTGATFKYDAFMDLGRGKPVYTSSCPVLAGKLGTEFWMDPIQKLVLKNFHVVDASAGICD